MVFLSRSSLFAMLYIVSIYLQEIGKVTRLHVIFRVSHLERSDLLIHLNNAEGKNVDRDCSSVLGVVVIEC